MNIQNAVLAAHRKWDLFPVGSTVVVGVSGGADSLALLHALASLRKRLGVQVAAATLDHGLRGAAGAEDAAHALRMAGLWNVPITAGQVDVRGEAARMRLGIEETARALRYRFLAQVAADQGTDRIAVAHHAGDQAETVLMHLFRGAGLNGLTGMRVATELPEYGIVLLRPLLAVTRREIDAYCQSHQIAAREDASNADTELARNWLRHTLLPLIETRFPGAPRALSNLAESVADDVDWLEDRAGELTAQAVVDVASIRLARSAFTSAPSPLQARFIRWAVHMLAPDAELSYERTAAAAGLFIAGERGQRIELPGGLSALVDREDVIVVRLDSWN